MSYLPWVSFILGLWLMIAPYALKYATSFWALWNSMVIGGLIAVVGLLTVRHEVRQGRT